MKKKTVFKNVNGKKAGVWSALLIAAVVIVLYVAMLPSPQVEISWKDIDSVSISNVGEATPDSGASGWLATFCLDYAETPGTCLASNASGGGYDSWGNVSGYIDADNTNLDLKSEDPFYFVVRCRFNQTNAASGGVFDSSRVRCYMTVSGDETISNVAGTIVESYNQSDADYMYVNFYWDDASDGYRITDDGSLAWNLTIQAKF